MATSEIEKLERRYAENPNGLTFAPLAEIYRKNGDTARALELLGPGVDRHPDYVPAHIVLGRCHLDLGAFAEAEQAFERVLTLDAENVIALKALADIGEQQDRYDDAERRLQALLAIDWSNVPAQEQLARLDAARRQALETLAAQDEGISAADPAAAIEGPLAVAAEPAAVIDEPPVIDELPADEQTAAVDAMPPIDELTVADELTPVDGLVVIDESQLVGEQAAADELTPVDGLVVIDESQLVGEQAAADELTPVGELAVIDESRPVAEPAVDERRVGDRMVDEAGSSGEAAVYETLVADESSSEANEPLPEVVMDDTGPRDQGGTGSDEPPPTIAEDHPAGGFHIELPHEWELRPASRTEYQMPDASEDLIAAQRDPDPFGSVPDAADTDMAGNEPPAAAWETTSEWELAPESPWESEPASEPEAVDGLVSGIVSEPEPEPDLEAAATLEYAAEADASTADRDAATAVAPATDDAHVDTPIASDIPEHIASPPAIVTETMAEVLLQQGHTADALRMYRELERRSGGDARLREKVAQIEADGAASRQGPTVYAASETGGESVGAFFRALLAARLPAAPARNVGGVAPLAASSPAIIAGAPTQPSAEALSLSAVFGEETNPAAVTDTARVSFDEFFGTPKGGSSAGGGQGGNSSAEDLDEFHAWLQSLKR